ncbi:hypothetical protein IC619_014825 [Hazenella sp. IB182353]|uniref:hypothetical protein n=1 Tax=Polycladospora coralii TaxID=2771432 RepID=UPI00174786E4|nr:hypothetical protein [Polycladospora coralii]MBS7531746.1 hypothetical protein [Polycladospora coralii]
MNVLKQSLAFYREHFFKILLIGSVFVLPVLFLGFLVIGVIYKYYNLYNLTLLADAFYSFAILLTIMFVQIPFVQMVKDEVLEDGLSLRSAFVSILKYGFIIYVMGIFYAIAVIIGSILFIIPGFIIMVLLFSFPQAIILEEEKWKEALKSAFQFGKQNLFKLLIFILLFTIGEWVVEFVVQFVTINFITLRYLYIILILLFTNMLFIPLFSFITSFKFLDWSGEIDLEEY